MATPHTFTKIVVHDLDDMARYYGEVFGLTELHRVQAEIAGEPIDEIILGSDGAHDGGLVLLKFVGRAAPPLGEVILGFVTDDAVSLIERGIAAGGRPHGEVFDPGVPGAALVGFLADPEGHLAEIVQTP